MELKQKILFAVEWESGDSDFCQAVYKILKTAWGHGRLKIFRYKWIGWSNKLFAPSKPYELN